MKKNPFATTITLNILNVFLHFFSVLFRGVYTKLIGICVCVCKRVNIFIRLSYFNSYFTAKRVNVNYIQIIKERNHKNWHENKKEKKNHHFIVPKKTTSIQETYFSYFTILCSEHILQQKISVFFFSFVCCRGIR